MKESKRKKYDLNM